MHKTPPRPLPIKLNKGLHCPECSADFYPRCPHCGASLRSSFKKMMSELFARLTGQSPKHSNGHGNGK